MQGGEFGFMSRQVPVGYALTPNESVVGFMQPVTGPNHDVFTDSRSGGNLINLSNNAADDKDPAWSPRP